MTDLTPLERALALAVRQHAGQADKAGAPYILHVLDVWQAVRADGHDETHQVAALLHDVVEDTDTTIAEIEQTFGAAVAAAVEALTHRPNEPNADYLARVKANPVARIVKLADSRNNHGRIGNITDAATRDRLTAKYQRVFDTLG
ncbi:MAG: HD domain-containing protein [Hyphomonas sp.]